MAASSPIEPDIMMVLPNASEHVHSPGETRLDEIIFRSPAPEERDAVHAVHGAGHGDSGHERGPEDVDLNMD